MSDIVERLRALAKAEHDDLSIGHEAADEITRLRSLTDWQPIETAPKDKDILLFVGETGEQFVAFWGVSLEDGDGQWIFARAKDLSFVVRNPTHWMPLPPQPKE